MNKGKKRHILIVYLSLGNHNCVFLVVEKERREREEKEGRRQLILVKALHIDNFILIPLNICLNVVLYVG